MQSKQPKIYWQKLCLPGRCRDGPHQCWSFLGKCWVELYESAVFAGQKEQMSAFLVGHLTYAFTCGLGWSHRQAAPLFLAGGMLSSAYTRLGGLHS